MTVTSNFRMQLNNKLYPLLLSIVEQDRLNTGQQLYHKMSNYITLASGLGNPTERMVKSPYFILSNIYKILYSFAAGKPNLPA